MTPDRQNCPACGSPIALHALVPWGDGQQTLPAAPWICAACAALGIIELASGTITLVPEHYWQVVEARNPTLWGEIVAARARIREAHP